MLETTTKHKMTSHLHLVIPQEYGYTVCTAYHSTFATNINEKSTMKYNTKGSAMLLPDQKPGCLIIKIINHNLHSIRIVV